MIFKEEEEEIPECGPILVTTEVRVCWYSWIPLLIGITFLLLYLYVVIGDSMEATATESNPAQVIEAEDSETQTIMLTIDLSGETVQLQDIQSEMYKQCLFTKHPDVANSLLDMVRLHSENHIVVVDEVVELFETIMRMQPAFSVGEEGGYSRAVGIAWDIYKEVKEVEHRTCSELSVLFLDNFGVESRVPKINPYILASMGYRESGFLKHTEQGYRMVRGKKLHRCKGCRGTRGEKGMFQIMPNGWIKRDFADCDLFSRPCNVRTAVRALEYI
ncbi:MAG: hypothetical protein ACXAEU_21060, partial [Candidatus Hodarchaeales archaeon]